MKHTNFVTSKEFPELLKQENWPELKRSIDNLKIWLVYNKGKSVAYAWDSKKISDESARKKAELKLLIEQIKKIRVCFNNKMISLDFE